MKDIIENQFIQITDIIKNIEKNLTIQIKTYNFNSSILKSSYKLFLKYLLENNDKYRNQIEGIQEFFTKHKININLNRKNISNICNDIDNINLKLKDLDLFYEFIVYNYYKCYNDFFYYIKNYEIIDEHILLYSNYLSFDTFEKIKKYINKKIILSFEYLHYKNDITIYCNKNDKNSKLFLKQIASRYIFLNSYLLSNNMPNLTIYLTNLKKYINLNQTPKCLNEKHINSAAIYGNNIIIWRKEEILKCILHECIHFQKIDFIDKSKKIENYLYDQLKIDKSSDIIIGEAYTEFLAVILNILFLIKNNYNSTKLKNYIKKEYLFSIKQIAHIFNYFNYNSFDDFLNLKNNQSITFKQSTDVISYYIIKSILLLNMTDIFNHNLQNSNCLLKYNNVVNINNINNNNYNYNYNDNDNDNDKDSRDDDLLLTIIKKYIKKDKNRNNSWIKRINTQLKKHNLKIKSKNKNNKYSKLNSSLKLLKSNKSCKTYRHKNPYKINMRMTLFG